LVDASILAHDGVRPENAQGSRVTYATTPSSEPE
jgi:hypothetical protein